MLQWRSNNSMGGVARSWCYLRLPSLVVLAAVAFQLNVATVAALGLEGAGTINPGIGSTQLFGAKGLWFDAFREAIIVANTEANRVFVLNRQGAVSKILGDRQNLPLPVAVASDGDATLFIALRDSETIKVLRQYDSGTGEEYTDLNLSEYRVKSAVQPVALFMDQDGNLHVADRGNRQIIVLDKRLSLKLQIPNVGEPSDVWVVAGRIYVADPGFGGIREYDGNGRMLRTLGTMPGQYHEPLRVKALAIDRNGRLWLLEEANRGIKAIDANGNLLARFGSAQLGGLELFNIADLAIDRENNLYVLEEGTNRIAVFRIRDF